MDRPLYYKTATKHELTEEEDMNRMATEGDDGWVQHRCKQNRRKQKQKLNEDPTTVKETGKSKVLEKSTNGAVAHSNKKKKKKQQQQDENDNDNDNYNKNVVGVVDDGDDNNNNNDNNVMNTTTTTTTTTTNNNIINDEINENINNINNKEKEEEEEDDDEEEEITTSRLEMNNNNNNNKKEKKSKSKKKNKKKLKKDGIHTEKSLVNVLSRIFSIGNRQQIEEVVQEMNLTSFDPNDGALRSRILSALIEKQQQKLAAPESDTENDYESEEKMHVETVQETPQGDYQKPEEIPSEQVSEDNKQKKKRRKKQKRRPAEDESQAVDSSGMMATAATTGIDEQENETGVDFNNPKNVLLRELNSFEPSEARSIEQIMKWKSHMEQNPIEFIAIFNELKGLEILIDKWVYCNQFRMIICEREFVELLSWLLPGDRDYHEYVMSQIIEICKCLDTLSSDKKKEMRDIMSKHCKQLLQVQTMHGYYTSGAATNIPHTTRPGTYIGDSFMPKPSSLLPEPGAKDPLGNKIRELDTALDNLTLIFQTLRQQQARVEQMKPTRNDSFRKVCNSIKTDMSGRINALTNERMKLQNQLQLVEHERKTIDSNINRALNPMQLEANQVASDIRVYTIQQKECEKKLLEINNMIEQLTLKHKQLSDKIYQVKSQYAPKEEQLHAEHQNYSFQSVALEKENKCYDYLIQLADESWRKLEEWSNDRMEQHRDEGELCESQFMEQCMNYTQLLVEDRTFLLNRLEHLKQMINNSIQHQLRTKQLYGDTLAMNSANINGDINVYKNQIAFDTQVLGWIEEQVKQVIVKCRDQIRAPLFQRFLSQISVILNTGGFPSSFLDQFNQDIYGTTTGGIGAGAGAGTGTGAGGNINDTRMRTYGGITGNPKIPPVNPNANINTSNINNMSNNNNINTNVALNPKMMTTNLNTNMTTNPNALNASTIATATPNTNTNTTTTSNPNIHTTPSNRRPPVHPHGMQTAPLSQPQVSHTIPVVPKRGPIGRDVPLIPNAATAAVTKQTQTQTTTNNPPSRSNQRRAPLSNENHRQ